MNVHTLVPLALLCAATGVHAGRPLATEDVDVLEPGRCELEGFAARERAAGTPAAHGATLQFGCGIGWRSQAALAHERLRSDGVRTRGWALVGKTALLPRAEGTTGVTLAWGLGAERPPGGSTEHESTFLAAVATREWDGGWLTHANLGWARSERASASTTTWNLAAEKPVGGGVDLMGELYGDDRTRPWFGLGVRWTASERVSLNASWAVQDSAPRLRLWTLGFKFAF